MEIIIFVAVVVGIVLVWSNYLKKEKSKAESAIDSWEPAKILESKEQPWPFGENLPEGKIHVKVADVASVTQLKTAWIEATTPAEPTGIENRVEAPAPVVEQTPATKPAAKKTAAKPAAAKKPPAKKKSV
jgi:hypothetical protein